MSYYNQPSPIYSRDQYYQPSTRQPYEDFSPAEVSPRSIPYSSSPYPTSPSTSSTYSTSPRSPYPTYLQPAPQPEMTCLFPNCRYTCLRKADMERHVAVTHIRETVAMFDCQVHGCHRRGNAGFTRKDKMIDHMREVHKCDIPKRTVRR